MSLSLTIALPTTNMLKGRRITYEYTLLRGINDGVQHAQQLAALLRSYDLLSHVNIIPWWVTAAKQCA
jgi:adenine C2-methylase RlmN of 23S rRNA A2503 and tRNA A37